MLTFLEIQIQENQPLDFLCKWGILQQVGIPNYNTAYLPQLRKPNITV